METSAVIPTELVSGETSSWDDLATTDSLGASVTSGAYALTYEFRGPVSLTLTAAAQGDGWRTSLSATNSATLTPGTYFWQAIATKSGAKLVLKSGRVVVSASLAGVSTAPYDGRTQAEKDLSDTQAAIRALAKGGVKSYTIGNRSLTKLDLPELLTLESKLKYEVAREQKADMIKNGLGNPNNLFVRFGKR